MLSNNDFKEKFLTPSAGDKSKNDKAWEMKQIRAWDQQVKAKSGTSVGTKKGPPGRPVVQEDIKEAASSEYRDRAAEVRCVVLLGRILMSKPLVTCCSAAAMPIRIMLVQSWSRQRTWISNTPNS